MTTDTSPNVASASPRLAGTGPAGTGAATRPWWSDRRPERSVGYIPALDGVRAVAIAMVLFFHGGFAWAQGGYVGVNTFFVLSGFLITSLLLAEHRDTGRIALRHFWVRRARRLLPAVVLLVAAMGIYAVWFAPPDTLGQLRTQALTTLFYGANWNQVSQGTGYFAALATPSPLTHTWSLAIEEQFYLVWPLVVVGVLRLARSRRALLWVAAAGAAASALEMALLYHGGAGQARVYYGTDTRAQDLLMGAVLAVVLARLLPARGGEGTPSRSDLRAEAARAHLQGRLARAGLVAAGGAGLGFLVWFTVATDAGTAWGYEGGFLLVAAAAGALIACVVLVPGSPWARALSLGPVRYLGRISYGVYLWHWPAIEVLDHDRTGLDGWALFGVRMAATVVVAAASYHLLELPVRRGLLKGWRGLVATPAGFAGAVAVVLGTTAGATTALSAEPATAAPKVHLQVNPGSGPNVPVVPAGTGGPIRTLLVGDSEASFLGFGLGETSHEFDVDFTDDGTIGCGLQVGPTRLRTGVEDGVFGIRGADVRVPCDNQQVRWRADVTTFHPDVVLLADGEYEVRDRKIDGKWLHIGQPVFDRLEARAIHQAVVTLRSAGSVVVLLTAPYYQQPEQTSGQGWPEDQPGRVDRYNAMLRAEAARWPKGTVVVENLNAHLDPGGHFAAVIDGVDVRYADGIHVTPAGGRLVAPWLLAQVDELGQANRARQGATTTTTG